MKADIKLTYASELLPDRLRAILELIPDAERGCISELRMRRGRFFSAVLFGKEYFITRSGKLMNSSRDAAEVGGEDIEHTFVTAFKGSVHSFPREQAEGFITCRGGNRVGFCGRAVIDPVSGKVTSVRKISSICIRIAREIRDCGLPIYERAFSDGLCSLIICSPPCGGKTTVLRDLCRLLGRSSQVCLVDERGEIACCEDGIPQNDVGEHTDVFDCYPRGEAIVTAVRTMSPDILICDEIGGKSDLDALEYCLDSGVRLLCSCHASDLEELKKRPAAGRLIKQKVFSCAAILGTGSSCGRLKEFYKL